MGISLDDLLDEKAPLPPPELKKKKRFPFGWNFLGCVALFQTLVITVLGALLLMEFLSPDERMMVVQMGASPLPTNAVIIYGGVGLQSTPTPFRSEDVQPILDSEPPVITANNIGRVRELTRFERVQSMAWTAAGRTLVIHYGQYYRWYDLYQQGPLAAEMKLQTSAAWPFAVSPDRRYLATASFGGQLIVWEIEHQRQRLKMGGFSGAPTSITYSHRGEFLAFSSQSDGLRVWNLLRSNFQWEVLPPAGQNSFRVISLDFSPDDRWLVSAGPDQKITVWDATTGAEVFSIPTDTMSSAAVFSPDSRYIAYAVAHNVIVWDVQTQQKAYHLVGHAGHVTDISFSPDGGLLASAGNDGNVMVWEMQTGERLSVLFNERLPIGVTDVAFSPDGRLIAAVYAKENAYPLVLWGVPDE